MIPVWVLGCARVLCCKNGASTESSCRSLPSTFAWRFFSYHSISFLLLMVQKSQTTTWDGAKTLWIHIWILGLTTHQPHLVEFSEFLNLSFPTDLFSWSPLTVILSFWTLHFEERNHRNFTGQRFGAKKGAGSLGRWKTGVERLSDPLI